MFAAVQFILNTKTIPILQYIVVMKLYSMFPLTLQHNFYFCRGVIMCVFQFPHSLVLVLYNWYCLMLFYNGLKISYS